MSNYRRLISYIYAYEGGTKGKNVGYAKLEVRGGQCKIQVNVKNIYVGGHDIGVYLLSPGAEIFIGKIFVRNGIGDFRAVVSALDIEGSGIGTDQCYGLTVHELESAWLAYTTIWEDAVAHAAEVELAEVTAEKMRSREAAEQPGYLSVAEEIERELQRELQWEQDTEESPEPSESPEPPESPELPGTPEAPELQEAEEAPGSPEAPETSEPPEHTETAEASEAPGSLFMKAEMAIDLIPEPGDPEQLRKLELEEQEAETRGDLWKRMRKRHTKIPAFEYDNGCEILSIQPQDIGLMPREIWVYGNNSFLLHGYYNYRHLIVARLENPKGLPRYLLGVPGHYFSNEKYMASMFGFPHFVLAKKQPQGDDRFGYWYTDIRLS